jgi:hypothetical protein
MRREPVRRQDRYAFGIMRMGSVARTLGGVFVPAW